MSLVVYTKGTEQEDGTFIPSLVAPLLSSAPHLNNPSTPVTVRFSSSTGFPQIADTDPGCAPRGFAMRFHLGGRKHTDIIAHSVPGFPVSTGAEFLEMFRAIKAGTVGDFQVGHPASKRFDEIPKPAPVSFSTQKYYGINAFKLVSAVGIETFFRYRFVPEDEIKYYTEEELKSKSDTYLHDEITSRVQAKPVVFKIMAQLANADDVKDDATQNWPENREQVELGTITIDKVVNKEDQAELQKKIIFDPVPRVAGLEASDDPLIDFRAAVYLVSGRERRAAAGYNPPWS